MPRPRSARQGRIVVPPVAADGGTMAVRMPSSATGRDLAPYPFAIVRFVECVADVEQHLLDADVLELSCSTNQLPISVRPKRGRDAVSFRLGEAPGGKGVSDESRKGPAIRRRRVRQNARRDAHGADAEG